MRYNPPANWPQPPAGWTPPQGWAPDPSWGPPPPGWQLWTPDAAKGHGKRNTALTVAGVLVVLVALGVIFGGAKSTPSSPTASSPKTTAAVTSTAARSATAAAATTDTTPPPAEPTTKPPAVLGANDAAKKDVKVTSCTKDALGFMDAKVLITNHSSKASNYIVDVVFETPDGKTQLGTGLAAVNDLQPGQKAPKLASSFTDADGKFACRVSTVTRYASGG